MAQKRLKAARVNGTALKMQPMPTACVLENSFSLPTAQAAFLARLGLDGTRARVVAELAWGGR